MTTDERAEKLQGLKEDDTPYYRLKLVAKLGLGIDLVIDSENEPFILKMKHWLDRNDKDFEGDTRKGFLIKGNVGSGKTMFGKLLSYFSSYGVVTTHDISASYSVDGEEGLRKYYSYTASGSFGKIYNGGGALLIDDLGAEPYARHYGKDYNAVEAIINRRYELFEANGTLTHFTTNLTNSEIEKRYGNRAFSRLKQMVTPLVLGAGKKSTDRREKASVKINYSAYEIEAEGGYEALEAAFKVLYRRPMSDSLNTICRSINQRLESIDMQRARENNISLNIQRNYVEPILDENGEDLPF